MFRSGNARGAIFMTLSMAAFTINDSLMKAVTVEVPLFQAILLRGLLTFAVLLFMAWRSGALAYRYAPRDRTYLALRCFGEVAGTLTFLSALRHMPLANLSAILQALPLAVTLAAAIFFREAVGWRRWLAILIGFGGVLLIVRPGGDGFDKWALLGVAAVGFVVIRDLATRRLSPEVPSVSVATWAALSVAAMAAILVPFEGWEPMTPRSAVMLVMTSGFVLVGYLAVILAMRQGEVSLVAPFRYTGLVFALILGWAMFGEFPDLLTLVGAGLVIATGIYTFARERRRGQKVAVPSPATLRLR